MGPSASGRIMEVSSSQGYWYNMGLSDDVMWQHMEATCSNEDKESSSFSTHYLAFNLVDEWIYNFVFKVSAIRVSLHGQW